MFLGTVTNLSWCGIWQAAIHGNCSAGGRFLARRKKQFCLSDMPSRNPGFQRISVAVIRGFARRIRYSYQIHALSIVNKTGISTLEKKPTRQNKAG